MKGIPRRVLKCTVQLEKNGTTKQIGIHVQHCAIAKNSIVAKHRVT